jgi:hypothetical protein
LQKKELLNDAAGNEDCDGFRVSFDDDVMKVKVKLSLRKSCRVRGWWNVGPPFLTLTYGTTRTAEVTALNAGRTLPRKESPWHLYLLVDPKECGQ